MTQYKRHPSPTGQWGPDGLTPVPEALAADLTVWFALPAETGAEQVWEGLACVESGPGRVLLRAVPLFLYDVGFGDEVEVVASAEGPLVATRIAVDAGAVTFRVFLDPAAASMADLSDVIRDLGMLGCLIEGYSSRLLGVSCRRGRERAAANYLAAAEHRGQLVYETGRQAGA